MENGPIPLMKILLKVLNHKNMIVPYIIKDKKYRLSD